MESLDLLTALVALVGMLLIGVMAVVPTALESAAEEPVRVRSRAAADAGPGRG